jgi:hypothetical protein
LAGGSGIKHLGQHGQHSVHRHGYYYQIGGSYGGSQISFDSVN